MIKRRNFYPAWCIVVLLMLCIRAAQAQSNSDVIRDDMPLLFVHTTTMPVTGPMVADVFPAPDNNGTLIAYGNTLGYVGCSFFGDAVQAPPERYICAGGGADGIIFIGSTANDPFLFTAACGSSIAVLRCGASSIDVVAQVISGVPLLAVLQTFDGGVLAVLSTELMVFSSQELASVTLDLPTSLTAPVSAACLSSGIVCWIGDANGTVFALSWASTTDASGVPLMTPTAVATGLHGPLLLSPAGVDHVVVANQHHIVVCRLRVDGTIDVRRIDDAWRFLRNASIAVIETSRDASTLFVATTKGVVIRVNLTDGSSAFEASEAMTGTNITKLALDPSGTQLFVATEGNISGAVIDVTSMAFSWMSLGPPYTGGAGQLFQGTNGSPVLCVPQSDWGLGVSNSCGVLFPAQRLRVPFSIDSGSVVVQPLRIIGDRFYALSMNFETVSIQVSIFDLGASVVVASPFAAQAQNVVASSDGRVIGAVSTGLEQVGLRLELAERHHSQHRVLMNVSDSAEISNSWLFIRQPDVVVLEAHRYVAPRALLLVSVNISDYSVIASYNFTFNGTGSVVDARVWTAEGKLVLMLSRGQGLLTFDAVDGTYRWGPAFPSGSAAFGDSYDNELIISPNRQYVAVSNVYLGSFAVLSWATGEMLYHTQDEAVIGFAFSPDGGFAICHLSGAVSNRDMNFNLMIKTKPIGCVGRPHFVAGQWYQTVKVPLSDGLGTQVYFARLSLPLDYAAIPAVYLFQGDFSTRGVHVDVVSSDEQIVVVNDVDLSWLGAVDLIMGVVLWANVWYVESTTDTRNNDPRTVTATLPGATNAVFSQTSCVRNLFTGAALERFANNRLLQQVTTYQGNAAVLVQATDSNFFYLYTRLGGLPDVVRPAGFRLSTGPPFSAGPLTTLPYAVAPTPAPTEVAQVPNTSDSDDTGIWAAMAIGGLMGFALVVCLALKLRTVCCRAGVPRAEYHPVQGA